MPVDPVPGVPAFRTLQNRPVPAAAANPALPPLPDPANTLAASKQRFPQVGRQYLTGEAPYDKRPAALEAQIRNMPPLAGMTPVIIGDGDTSRVALMPNAGVTDPDVGRKIQQNIMEGKALFGEIMSGSYTRQASKEEMTKLTWYLQALGSAKAAVSSGGSSPAVYKEGGMFIEDPDGHLQQFLTNANSYSRSSSHMREYQALGDEFSPRGVDIRNAETPNQRRTILFARLPMDSEVPAGGPKGTGDKRMLFVKMEPHGCRGLTTEGGFTPRAQGTPSGWKGVKRFFANAKDLFLHGTSFLRSVGQRIGLVRVDGQNNRERVPSDLKRNYKTVLEFLGKAPLDGDARMTRELLDTLNRGNPQGDSGGIKTMLENVRAAAAYLTQAPSPGPGARHLASTLLAFEQTLAARGDHPDMRIGHEVIVTQEETDISISLVKPYDGKRILSGSGSIDAEARDIIIAGYQYQLDNIDNVNLLDVFKADSHRATYMIGDSGNEVPVVRDSANAALALMALTGNDTRVATALATLTNQTLPVALIGRMTTDMLADANVIVPPGGLPGTHYGISRLPENAQGEPVYVVSYQADTQPAVVTSLGTNITQLDQNASLLKCQISIQITVHANGSMTPEFVTPPSYSYTLVPQQPQEAVS